MDSYKDCTTAALKLACEQGQSFALRLSDQHPIEGITMMQREIPSATK